MDKMHLVHYSIFQSFPEIKAFTTTKKSLGSGSVRFTGDHEKVYAGKRRELARLLGLEVRQLVFPRQTHSANVTVVDSVPDIEIADTDALVTNKSGICLCVQTADCVPVLLFDCQKKVLAAVHAGWRGTVAKIVGQTIAKMKTQYGCNPQHILAAIGPAVGPRVYEVGDEVVNAVRAAVPRSEETLQKFPSGKFHVDLWQANRNILTDCGVLEKHIEVLAECTVANNAKYYSARRDGIDTGRMVSGIILGAK